MTTTITERKTLPPIQCQPWCVYQDGHAGEVHREDQNCYGDSLRVEMTRHKWVAEGHLRADGTFGPSPDHVFVELLQNGHEREAAVVVRRECDDQPVIQWRFTPREALELSHALQLLLGQIGDGR